MGEHVLMKKVRRCIYTMHVHKMSHGRSVAGQRRVNHETGNWRARPDDVQGVRGRRQICLSRFIHLGHLIVAQRGRVRREMRKRRVA